MVICYRHFEFGRHLAPIPCKCPGDEVDCTIKMFVCLLDNVTMCLERLTVQDKEKEIFNGKVVEPLVLLVEVC